MSKPIVGPRLVSLTLLGGALAYLVVSLALYATHGREASMGFWMLGKFRMHGFADLRWITAESGCHSDLWKIAIGEAGGCDPYGQYSKGLGYPPLSIWIGRFLGVEGGDTGILGLTLGLSFIAVVLLQVRRAIVTPWIWRLSAALLLLAYPVQLATERMNLDVPIFLLLCLAAEILGRAQTPIGKIAALTISFATVAFKIYPLFGYLAWFVDRRNHGRQHRWLLLAVAIGISLALAQLIPWIRPSSIPTADGLFGSFGIKAVTQQNDVLVRWLGNGLGRWAIYLLVISKPICMAAGFVLAYRSRLAQAITSNLQANRINQNPDVQRCLVQLTAGSWLGCYATIISYDYRHIFLIPLISQLIAVASRRDSSANQKALVFAVCVAASITFFWPILALQSNAGYYLSYRVISESLIEMIGLPFVAGLTGAILIGWAFGFRGKQAHGKQATFSPV